MSAKGYRLGTATVFGQRICVNDWKHLQSLPAGQGDRATHPFQGVPKTQKDISYEL